METPAVGMPATLIFPQDRYPYVVKAVSSGGNKVTLEELELPADLEPAERINGFPVFDHTFTENEIKDARRIKTIYAYRTKCGYYHGPSLISFGKARYYRDYSD